MGSLVRLLPQFLLNVRLLRCFYYTPDDAVHTHTRYIKLFCLFDYPGENFCCLLVY